MNFLSQISTRLNPIFPDSNPIKLLGMMLIICSSMPTRILAGDITGVANGSRPDSSGNVDVTSQGGEALVTLPIGDSLFSEDIEKEFTSLNPIDIVFEVTNNQNNPNRQFIREIVTNQTDKDWSDYHFELGFGIGRNFRRSSANDLLDFGTTGNRPPQTPAGGFSDAFRDSPDEIFQQNGNVMWFEDGQIRDNSDSGFRFFIDIPESNTIPEAFRNPDGSGFQFTLRQFPTVKEPPRKKHDRDTPGAGNDGGGTTSPSMFFQSSDTQETLSFSNITINSLFLDAGVPSINDPLFGAEILIDDVSLLGANPDGQGWFFDDTMLQILANGTSVLTANIVDSFLFRGGGDDSEFDSEFQGGLTNISINNAINSSYLNDLQAFIDEGRSSHLAIFSDILSETNNLDASGASDGVVWIDGTQQSVPEPSSTIGLLTFITLGASSTLFRQK